MTQECDVPDCTGEAEYELTRLSQTWSGVVCKRCVFEMFGEI
jgi:hypothetical protein